MSQSALGRLWEFVAGSTEPKTEQVSCCGPATEDDDSEGGGGGCC